MIAAEVTVGWFAIDIESMQEWCNTSIGPQALSRDHVDADRPWYATSEYNKLIVHFANEADALLFRLKWCSK